MGAADRIADTLLRIGEIQGTAANRSAEIQARALEQAAQARAQGVTGSADALARATAANGQIWGQTLGSLGELPNQYLRTAAALKTNDLENQGRQIQIDRAKQVQAGEAAFQKILPQIPRGQDGLFDVSAATPVFASSGMTAEQTSNMIRTLDALNQAQVGVNKTRIDHAADLANHALEDAKKTGEPLSVPGAVLWLNGAREAGVATDAEVNQIKQGLVNGADPTHIFSAIRGQSDKYKPKPEKLSAGDVVVDLNNPGGQPLASAPEKPERPVVLGQGAVAVNPTTGATIATGPAKEPTPKSLQSKSVLLDGKPTEVNYNPTDGSWMVGGQTINASRIKPIPAASVQINNAQTAAAQNSPDWTRDPSRPTGPDANKADPVLGLTPNAVYQGAINFIQDGQLPNMGMSRDPRVQAKRDAYQNKAAAIAADAGMDIPTLRATFKANKASLDAQQKMQDSVQQFISTADRNADKLRELLPKIGDTGSPVFNKPLRTFAQQVKGDPNLSAFATYLQSVRNEYSRIISQPNLAGQLSDSARSEGSALLDEKATVPQMLASINALQTEGTNRLISIGDQIKRITGRMGMPGASAPTTPAPTLRYNPATGNVEPIQ